MCICVSEVILFDADRHIGMQPFDLYLTFNYQSALLFFLHLNSLVATFFPVDFLKVSRYA